MTPYLADPDVTLYHGDALDVLRSLPDASVDCCVTSPPYWGLRDYGSDAQVGLESTPAEYVDALVTIFAEVRRVLTAGGTVWLNLGDSYAQGSKGNSGAIRPGDKQGTNAGSLATRRGTALGPNRPGGTRGVCKPKDLVGIPWRVAFALQADGWWLRSDIVWSKPNPMPESVRDRPTKSHEYVFLLAKSESYYFGQEDLAEPADWQRWGDQTVVKPQQGTASWIKPKSKQELTGESRPAGRGDTYSGFNGRYAASDPAERKTRNTRSVWQIATEPYPGAHFAVFPRELARRCILGGCPERVCRTCRQPSERIIRATGPDGRSAIMRNGKAYDEDGVPLMGDNMIDHGVRGSWNSGGHTLTRETVGWTDCGHNAYAPGVVLDPFAGSGTTMHVARTLQRNAVGIELNADYCRLAAERLQQLSLLASEPPAPRLLQKRHKGLTGGAYNPPGQSPHSNARKGAA